jgi:Carbohydrate binding domain
MATSHWKPLSDDLPGAARDLAERMRVLLDDKGLSLRRLAEDAEVPYSVSTLHRFFSGQARPPRWLLEVIARRCEGDLHELYRLAEVAEQVTERSETQPSPNVAGGETRLVLARHFPADAPSEPETMSRRQSTGRGLSGPVLLALAGFALLSVIGAVMVALNVTGEPRPAAQARQSPTVRSTLGGELIRNGHFSDTTKPWWPDGGVRIKHDDQRLRAEIKAGGTEPWDAQIGYSGLWLRKGHAYVLAFHASSQRDVTIRISVQLEGPPYTAALLRGVTLNTSTRRYSYPFTSPLTTTHATVNFQFGGQNKNHVALLDNVSLTRLG